MAENTRLLDRLRQAGLLTDPSSETFREAPTPIPWYLQALQALSGWLASLFMLLTLGATFHRLFDTPSALLIVGTLLVASAYFALRDPSKILVVEHGALAVSLAGQALIAFAFFQWTKPYLLNQPAPWLALSVMEGILLLLIPHYLHRILSALVAGSALMYAAELLGVGAIALPLIFGLTVWIWCHEFSAPKQIMFRQAVGYGLSLALFWKIGSAFEPGNFFPGSHLPRHLFNDPGLRGLLDGVVMLLTLHRLVRKRSRSAKISTVALWLPFVPLAILSVWMQGLSVALTLLIVGFVRGNLFLQGMSFAALLWTAGRFYYTLQTTLLVKSLLLIAAGLVLLILYGVLRRMEGTRDVL